MGGYGSGLIRGQVPRHNSRVDQPKMRRIISAMALLYHRPVTVKELADHLDCSDRTANRMLNTLEAGGLTIECTMNFKYFLVKYDSCPVCGKIKKKKLTK